MGLEFAASFNDVGASLVIDQSGKGRHLDLSSANASQVAGGHDRGALGKTGATMPVLPAAVLAASQTDDRCIMVDYQSDLTTWIVRFDDPTFGSGMWGLLNLGSPNSVQGQARDNSGSHNLMTRPSATAPGASWHNYALVYVRATGVCSIYRDGVFVTSQSFTAGTQLSTSATAINIAEWTTTGPTLDNLRIFSHAPRADEILALANSPVMPDSPIAVLTSGVLGPGLFQRPWRGTGSDLASTSSQNGTLAITGTSAVGLAGTLDQPAAIAPVGTASVGLAAFADRPAALAATGVASVGLSGTRDQPASLAAVALALVGLAGTVTQPGTLPVTGAAAVSLSGTRDQPVTLPVTGAAAVALAAVLDQHATLAVGGSANVALAAVREQFAALAPLGLAAVGLAGVLEQPATLAVVSASTVGLLATRSTDGALVIAGVTTVGLDTLGTKTGSLDVTAAALVALAGTLEVQAGLQVTAASSLQLLAGVEVSGTLSPRAAAAVGLFGGVSVPALLAVVAAARVGLVPLGEAGGALLLDVGQPHDVEWLAAGTPEERRALLVERVRQQLWLIAGPSKPV